MLFHSYAFLFGFLPVVLLGFFWIGAVSRKGALVWLAAASLFFYGVWDFRYLGLLLGSIAWNYGVGEWIRVSRSRAVLFCGVAVNLLVLGYFKYADFFLNACAGSSGWGGAVIPLGISFFTFTQVAYLVDRGRGRAESGRFLEYVLFVTYFPHLIAGPVLDHRQILPQFTEPRLCCWRPDHVARGLSIFVVGLAKKLWLADALGGFANKVFDAASGGMSPTFLDSWAGALAYSLQIYFDFSAYSEMAIGISAMFNIRLPLNFASPYKAASIIEFWRLWHITLSRFLRDYLYVPLGGNRRGPFRRHLNLMVTMLLGGLWHGAGWTFVLWGGLHGFYLWMNHGWRTLKTGLCWGNSGFVGRAVSIAGTFLAVVFGWVLFRADSVSAAGAIFRGMLGLNGVRLPISVRSFLEPVAMVLPLSFSRDWSLLGPQFGEAAWWIALGMGIVWFAPNVCQMFLEGSDGSAEALWKAEASMAERMSGTFLRWQPTVWHGAVYGVLFVWLLMYLKVDPVSEFLYFQF